MKLRETMRALEDVGSAQTRKTYGRHGVSGKQFGVSYGALGNLKKRIGVDHALAEQLWRSGNHDARVLSTMIAAADEVKSSTLDGWARELDSYVITNAFSSLVSRTPFAHAKFEKWNRSKSEWVASAGWETLSYLAGMDNDLDNAFFIDQLRVIEAGIHDRLNRVRHAMNQALIAIGGRNAPLRKRACTAARRIGTVEVDHGQTGCTTPRAVPYIDKMWKHKEVMESRRMAREAKKA